VSRFEKFWHKTLRQPYKLSLRIDQGNGQSVVLLHGLAVTAENWHYVTTNLNPERYRSVAFDLLGFGDSPKPDWSAYSVDDHAHSIVASLRKNHVQKPIVLVGHSMGAIIAVRISKLYPDLVKHLILYQMPVYSDSPEFNIKDMRHKAYVRLFESMLNNPKLLVSTAARLGKVVTRVAHFEFDERSWYPFEQSLRHTIMQEQVYRDLHELRMPIDVIYGRLDMLVLRRSMKRLFSSSAHVRFHQLNETHQISGRAAKVIVQLIEQQNSTKTSSKKLNKYAE
jgi:pimeloyl-ACP methyl ester carboxylesterase